MGSFSRWSAYGSVGRLTKFLFLFTNFISMLFLSIVFVYGCWLNHNRAQYSELLAPSLYVDVSRIMIIVSLIAIINSIFSFYSVQKELRCMIYSFGTASFILFIMLLMGGIMGFVFYQKLQHQIPLNLKMLTSLKETYGLSDFKPITEAWDDLQRDFKCCGVDEDSNYMVWKTSKWYMHLKEPKQPLPLSCCVPGEIDACLQGNITSIYTRTCYMPLKNDLSIVMKVGSWILMVASFFMLVPAVFASVYALLIRK